MAEQDKIPFDYLGAKKAGYSDGEIMTFLKDKYDFDFDLVGAKKSGYTDQELADYITAYEPLKKKDGLIGSENGLSPTGSNRQAVIDWVRSTSGKQRPSIPKGSFLQVGQNKPITKEEAQIKAGEKIESGQSAINLHAEDPLGDLQKSSQKDLSDKLLKGEFYSPQTQNKAKIDEEEINIAKDALASDGFDATQRLKESKYLYASPTNETANFLKQKADKYNKTVEGLRNLVGDQRYDFKNAAIKAFANSNPVFKKELKAGGFDINDVELADKLPDAKVGQILDWFTKNPDTKAFVTKENPNLAPIFEDVKGGIMQEHPEYAINQVANKVSQARIREMKTNPLFDWTESDKDYEMTNKIAEKILTPEELKVYNQTIRERQSDYLDKPSGVAGIAEGIRGTFKGIGELVKQPFTSNKELMMGKWNEEANNVSANPEGLLKVATDTGSVLGLVMTMGATGNVTGLGAVPNTVLTFGGEAIKHGREKYPDSPVKAATSAVLETALYAALSKDIFPVKGVNQAFSKVRPEVGRIVEKLSDGAITKEAARQEVNTVFKKMIDLAGGALKKDAKITAELTGIQAVQRGLDKIMMDEETFKEHHPDDELAKSLVHNFLSNAVLAGITKVGEAKKANRIFEETIYEAAQNPKQTERLIDNESLNLSFGQVQELKTNLKYASNVVKDLQDKGFSQSSQKAFLFQSLREKVANEKAESTTDLTFQKEQKEIAKEANEIKEQILQGKDPDEIVTTEQQKKIDEQEKNKVELERLTFDRDIALKKVDDKIEQTDGRESEANRIKLQELKEEKRRINEDYEKKIAKLKPTQDVPQEKVQDIPTPQAQETTPQKTKEVTEPSTLSGSEKDENVKGVKEALDKFENSNYTANDVADIVENLDIPELKDAISKFREEQDYDRELSGRGDMDSANDNLMAAIENYVKEKSKPQEQKPSTVSGSEKESKSQSESELSGVEEKINNEAEKLNQLQQKIDKSNEAYKSIKSFENSFNGFLQWVKDSKEKIGYKGSAIGYLSKLQEDSPNEVTKLLGQYSDVLISRPDFEKQQKPQEQEPSTVIEQGKEEKPKVRISAEQLEERQPEKIRERYVDDFNIVEDSKFDWRVTSELSSADRKKAVADIKAGKDTAAARKLNKEIDETLKRGTVIINRGRGANAETVEIPIDEWFQFTPIEHDKAMKAAEQAPDEVISIIRDNDITLDNIDSLKQLFNGFPYDEADFNNVKTFLQGETTRNAEATSIGEKSNTEKIGSDEPTTIPETNISDKPSDITTKEGISTSKGTPEPAQKKSVLERPIEEVSVDDILRELRVETEGLAFKDISNKDIKDGDGKNIEAYNQRAEKVLKAIYPNAEFNSLSTAKEYEQATGRKGEAGVLIRGKEGKHQLFLNLEAIKGSNIERTATHEVIHALVSDAMGVKYADLKTKWENLLPKLYNVKGFEVVKEHIQNYSSADRPVEGITDLLANIVHEKIKIEDIPKNLWDEFIALVNRAFEAIGIDYKITPDTFNGFATSVKEAFETGNFKNLEKFTSKGKTEKFFKQYPEFAEATAMVDPAKRKQLEDLLRRKIEQEIKAGKLTEQDAKKIFDQAGVEPPKGTGKEIIGGEEKGGIGIRHIDTKELREQKGLPEYEKERQTVEQWRAEATERIKKGEMLALLEKMKKGEPITDVEQLMMGQHIANLDAELLKSPSKENLDRLNEAIELSDKVGGTMWGRSGRARQESFLPDDSLGTFLREKEAAQGTKLSEKQVKDESAKYEELKAAKEKLEKQLEEERSQHAKDIAELGFNKARVKAKKAAKKSNAEYKAERQASIDAAKEALKKLRQDPNLKATIPLINELKAIAPHVKDVLQSLANQGIDKLDVAIENLHSEFKDVLEGLTKKHILDIIAGDYDEIGQTRVQKANTARLLKREAQLLKELAAARKGEQKAKKETDKTVFNRRIDELKKKIEEVKKINKERVNVEPFELTENEQANLDEQIKLQKRAEKLEQDIRDKKYLEEKEKPKPFARSRKTQELQDKVIDLENKIRHERQKDEYSKRSKVRKAFDKVMEILGVRRLIQSAVDISVPFRQGATLISPRKIDVWAKGFKANLQSVFSPKRFERIMYEIRHDPEYHDMVKDRVVFNDLGAADPDLHNEDFRKSFIYKIPIISEPLKASNRSADAFLNVARFEMYKKMKRQLENKGLTRESDPEAYKFMGNWIMSMTGRGRMTNMLENSVAHRVLGNTFYGARLMASRFNLLNPVTYFDPRIPKEAKVEAMKDMLSFTVTTMATGLALAAAGGKISLNPDDSDFLQVRFGNKVYDISGGLANYIRTGLRFLKAAYTKVSGTKYQGKQATTKAGESVVNFFRNKLSPNTAYAVDAFFGGSYGQEFDPTDIVELYPMYTDDVLKAMKDEGAISLATVLLPNIVGIGYGSYASKGQIDATLEELKARNLRSEDMNNEKIRNFNKEGHPLITDKEFKEFANKRDAEIEKGLEKLFNEGVLVLDDNFRPIQRPYKELTKEQVAKETTDIKAAATEKIKKELFGEQKKSIQQEVGESLLEAEKEKRKYQKQ